MDHGEDDVIDLETDEMPKVDDLLRNKESTDPKKTVQTF